jgi:NAD-dependent dihydropyrimidine dehydrogenase PreA subunit
MASIIDYEKCVRCKTCYERCPEDVYGMDENGGIYVRYPDECCLCGACEMDCPAGALTVAYDANSKLVAIKR